MWHECSRPYRPTDEGSFGHEMQVKVYLRVLACSLNNPPLGSLGSLGSPCESCEVIICTPYPVLAERRRQHWSAWFPVFCDFFCLASVLAVSTNLKFSEFFWVSSLSRWVNVILMWMFSVLRKIVLKLNHESLLPPFFIIIILRL